MMIERGQRCVKTFMWIAGGAEYVRWN